MPHEGRHKKVNNNYYALVILMPGKNLNAQRHSGRKNGKRRARTELGPYFIACESFFAYSDTLGSQIWHKVITAGRPERIQGP